MNMLTRMLKRTACEGAALWRRIHRDERGTISILTVLTVFMLTIVLGMVFNIARQLDDKLRMQNAADAACYTGTLTVSRGMNAIAFSNHLLCEVFALTAYMREGAQRYSESFTPEVLATWQEVGAVFESTAASAGYQKFEQLGRAIQEKLQYEQAVVTAFSELTYQQSQLTLPVFEYILRTDEGRPPTNNSDVPLGGSIPRFQRAVVLSTPQMAQAAALEISHRHGQPGRTRHELAHLDAVMYRTDRTPFENADEYNWESRTLPAVDPSPTGLDPSSMNDAYYQFSVVYREQHSRRYLRLWIDHWMFRYFDYNHADQEPASEVASLSKFIEFWKIFTGEKQRDCGQLGKLLTQEFPTTNLPFMIRVLDPNNNNQGTLEPEGETLRIEYNFLAVVTWPQLEETFPGVFGNPLNGDRYDSLDNTDAAAFAQASMFIPARRFLRIPSPDGEWGYYRPYIDSNGVQQQQFVPWVDAWDPAWSLFNQNWRTRLEPVTSDAIVDILPSNLIGVFSTDVHNISMH